MYMDIYGCLKSITHIYNTCGASIINNQIILFDGHDSHFDDRTIRYTEDQRTQRLFLKSGDSYKDHPNDNFITAKLKSN